MGTYQIAEICLNGHVTTNAANLTPELREKFCSKCGEETISECPVCDTPIRGRYDIPQVIDFYLFTPSAYCYNCGEPFPWTERTVNGAVEFAKEATSLSEDELRQLKEDLQTLTKDSPKVSAASYRFKQVMAKVGNGVASGIRDIVIDLLSETAKKLIWP